jgi:transcriptional regulator with XRE-family HTH domain
LKNRIQEVRKDNKLTQDEFAVKINLSKNFVSLMETGNRVPSDRTIADICREFNINEEWLRTGSGEKEVPLPMKAHLMALFSDVSNETDSFRRSLFNAMAKMTPDEWKLLERIANDLKDEMDKKA